ncbi:hypothetical protein VN97_g11685 [Penicillium thymicola]|uniref:F-box domain-containing protein n=1 Tax=Penicillium thymicola TaxID=293382 RepID=A0AAI9T6R7_PENTH|nr:hypothetical protein VN97_g11685 [Penicillium thymicola]
MGKAAFRYQCPKNELIKHVGWSEARCQFCGMSFNIARKGKVGEPDVASWRFGGDSLWGYEQPVEDLDQSECLKQGCALAVIDPEEEEDDPVNDPAFVPKSEDCDEYDRPYKYDPEHESNSGDHDDLYRDFLTQTIYNQSHFTGEPVGPFVYASTSVSFQKDILVPLPYDSPPDGYSFEDLEHIPGPKCLMADAYPGSGISLAEMRGCRTVQFLVHKSLAEDGPWQADVLHEPWGDFEEWFLPGLSDGMESRDGDVQHVFPARGGVNELWEADTLDFHPERLDLTGLAMPFHPWCFDIFSRQSKLHFGNKVNIAGLINWRNAECSLDANHDFPRHPDVARAQQQVWMHDPDAAYLVANPLHILGLTEFLLGAAQEKGDFDIELADEESDAVLFANNPTDRLSALPPELRLHIVSFLDSGDIMSLRQASKAFMDLTNNVWYRIVRGQMPWLWETWEEDEIKHSPSPWTFMTANEVKTVEELKCRYTAVLSDEYEYATTPDKVIDYLLPRPAAVVDQGLLSKNDTNWYRVFRQIRTHWPRVKGLRNRARIWTDVEEVIRRIRMRDSVELSN